mgnify:CR=1 FL=1
MAAPPLLWALARFGETRRLAAAGYGQRDIAVALEREASEQAAAIAEQRRSRVRRILDGLLGGSLVAIGAVVAVIVQMLGISALGIDHRQAQGLHLRLGNACTRRLVERLFVAGALH